jgi:hypothetical protein
MKRTPLTKALSPEGIDRRKNRFIAEKLKMTNPELYAQLEQDALQRISDINNNPLSAVVDRGLNTFHLESPAIKLAKKIAAEQKKAAMRERVAALLEAGKDLPSPTEKILAGMSGKK